MNRSSTSTSPSRSAAVCRVRVSGLADDPVERPERGGQPGRLPAPHVVQPRVEPAEQQPGGVRRGAAVADEVEHGRIRPHGPAWPSLRSAEPRAARRLALARPVRGPRRAAARQTSVRSSRPVRTNARRRTGSARPKRRKNHTSATAPATSSSTFHQPRSTLGQRRVLERPPGERPPEHLGAGEGAVQHEVQERADGQEDPPAPGRPPPDRGQHHHHEQHHAEDHRVQHPRPAEEPVDEVGEQHAEQQHPVVDGRVVEHQPGDHQRSAQEPEQHRARAS